jgi:hypothetical protein
VWHNLSTDEPLVFLSIYWMPVEQPAEPAAGAVAKPAAV